MIKLALNLKKVNNYAFFCPVSRLHLTLSNPVGQVDRITSNILRGIKSKVLIDVDGVVDLDTGELIEGGKKPTAPVETPKAEVKKSEPITEDKAPEAPVQAVEPTATTETPVVTEEVKEETPKKKAVKKPEAEEKK